MIPRKFPEEFYSDSSSKSGRSGTCKICRSEAAKVYREKNRKPKPSFEETFWSKVDKNGPVVRDGLGNCWTWTKAVKDGYGIVVYDGMSKNATLPAWELTFGPKPEGLFILHKCDNRACVNPDHLFLGSKSANSLDMAAKGRHLFGSKNPVAKLSESDIPRIKELVDSGLSYPKVAAILGVSKSTVSRIYRGERWKHAK